MKEKMRLGDLLLEKKVVTENDIKMALAHLKEHGGKLGQALVTLNIITEDKLLAALRHHLNIPSVNLKEKSIPEEILKMLPGDVAKKYVAVPVKRDESAGKKRLYVAMSNPLNLGAIEDMQFVTGVKIVPVLCMESEIIPAVERYYGKFQKGEVTDDLTAWRRGRAEGKKAGDEEEWVKKMGSIVSKERSKKPKMLDGSYFATLKNERMVLRALVNLIIRYDIFSIDEIEEEIRRVEREFDI